MLSQKKVGGNQIKIERGVTYIGTVNFSGRARTEARKFATPWFSPFSLPLRFFSFRRRRPTQEIVMRRFLSPIIGQCASSLSLFSRTKNPIVSHRKRRARPGPTGKRERRRHKSLFCSFFLFLLFLSRGGDSSFSSSSFPYRAAVERRGEREGVKSRRPPGKRDTGSGGAWLLLGLCTSKKRRDAAF